MNSGVGLYSAVGEELTHYEVDAEGAALLKRGAVRFPVSVQYAGFANARRICSARRPSGNWCRTINSRQA